ncbi:MAG: HEPN domain-containing protein [Candidatus Hydrogenedentota bacterium]
MRKITKLWFKRSLYDYTTAKAMYRTKRYLYVIYCCHQTVEKLLKVSVIEKTNRPPPYSHNLLKLLNLSGIKNKVPEKFITLTEFLNPYYLPTKYPDVKQELLKIINKAMCKNILNITGEFVKWLKRKLK